MMLGARNSQSDSQIFACAWAAGDVGQTSGLEVRNLRCGHLLSDVSLSLRPGEVLGVAALEGQARRNCSIASPACGVSMTAPFSRKARR